MNGVRTPRSRSIFGGLLPFFGFKTSMTPHRCDEPGCDTVALRLEGFAIGWFNRYLYIYVTITPLGDKDIAVF